MQKATQPAKKTQERKYPRRKIEFEMRLGHPIDDQVTQILNAKKPDMARTQWMRETVLMMDAAEKGDFSLLLAKFGGQMLMQGLIGTQLQPRMAVQTPIINQIEPPVTSEDSAQIAFDLLI